jgi:hypothetical protein
LHDVHLLAPIAFRKPQASASSKKKRGQSFQLPDSDDEAELVEDSEEEESDDEGLQSHNGSFSFASPVTPQNLAKLKEKNQREGRYRNTKRDWQIGDRCEALWEEDQLYYKAVIFDVKDATDDETTTEENLKSSLGRPRTPEERRQYSLTFDDGQIGEEFTFDNMREMVVSDETRERETVYCVNFISFVFVP